MRNRIVGLCAVALAIWFALGGLNTRGSGDETGSTRNGAAGVATGVATGVVTATAPAMAEATVASAIAPTPAKRPASSQIGFRSRAKLEEHFAKHGREFGRLTIEDYLAKAQQLRDATPGADVLEIIRRTDGVISRYDRSTGAFLATDADGTIRTFFKPNDGEAYFRRQATRSPSP